MNIEALILEMEKLKDRYKACDGLYRPVVLHAIDECLALVKKHGAESDMCVCGHDINEHIYNSETGDFKKAKGEGECLYGNCDCTKFIPAYISVGSDAYQQPKPPTLTAGDYAQMLDKHDADFAEVFVRLTDLETKMSNMELAILEQK